MFWKARTMAQQCEFCGKTPKSGHRVSHAHNVTNRKWNLNLQTVRSATPGGSKRVRACTRCIRSGRVIKPVVRATPAAAAKAAAAPAKKA